MNLALGKQSLFIAACLLLSLGAKAELRKFQTTRLLSTSGTGVGSILMDEATLLNPASLAFFTVTSLYVQKGKSEFSPVDTTAPNSTNKKGDELNFIASDSNGSAGASLSYLTQDSGPSSRNRWAMAVGTPVDKTSAMGVTVSKTTDKFNEEGSPSSKNSYTQVNLGVTHALSNSFTLGLTGLDILKRVPEEVRALVGIQYVYEDFIVLMADGGANYTQSLSESSQIHGALQFKVFSDFFLRVGAYEDKAMHERGNSGGVSWVSPKIVIEVALARKTLMASENIRPYSLKLKETAFSFSYRF